MGGGIVALSIFDSLSDELSLVANAAAAASEPLRLTNINTNEAYDVDLFVGGQWNPNAVTICDYLLRDWRAGQTVRCDQRIYAGLYVMQHYFAKGQRLRVHSGFRTQATNQRLREAGYNPAVNSQHLLAKAIDFSIPGVDVADIAKVAYSSNQCGVGCYRRMGFVHWDFRGTHARWGDSF